MRKLVTYCRRCSSFYDSKCRHSTCFEKRTTRDFRGKKTEKVRIWDAYILNGNNDCPHYTKDFWRLSRNEEYIEVTDPPTGTQERAEIKMTEEAKRRKAISNKSKKQKKLENGLPKT